MQTRRRSLSIYTSQAFFYLLIIVVISLIFGTLFFKTARTHLEAEVGRKLQDIANIAAGNIPQERVELIKPGDDRTRMVLRLKKKMKEIQEATGVENVFVFRPDSTSVLDLRPHKMIGTHYTLSHFKQDFLDRLREGLSVNTASYRSSDGEIFISAYAPILDNHGRLLAIVGVDAGTKEIEVIERMKSRLFLIAGLSVCFAFLLALVLARALSGPIRSMAKTARRVGDGDYSARVTVPRISELEILAKSINKMARQVQARDASLKEMSANVAHEIRNPLNSIKLLLAVLGEDMKEEDDPASMKTIETLNYEIGKLNRFLTEFLTYSRPMNLDRRKVDPYELTQRSAEMALAAADEKEVVVQLNSEPNLPLLTVDGGRIEQALLNIILNAIEACEKNGRVNIFVHKDPDGKSMNFRIEDTGVGIDEEDIQKIFEPFFTTKSAGTGLGLVNAEKIVRDHGGNIQAENIPGGGVRITIRLPLESLDIKDD